MTSTSPIGSTSLASTVAGTQAGAQTPATRTLGNGNADLDRFLTLLTAQLKHQNPMQPTDPTQFVAQLAQFSQVEQQTRSNTLLQQISGTLGGNQISQAAALIGTRVGATASSVVVPATGTPAPLTVAVTDNALANPRVVVTDAGGTVLRTIPVRAGQTSVAFDGRDERGNRLAAGTYGVGLLGDAGAGRTQQAGTISAAGRVTELRSQAGAFRLVLDDGRVVDLANVTAVTP